MVSSQSKIAALNRTSAKSVVLVNPTDAEIRSAVAAAITRANGKRRTRTLDADYFDSLPTGTTVVQDDGGCVANSYRQAAYTTRLGYATATTDAGRVVVVHADESNSCKSSGGRGPATRIWTARDVDNGHLIATLVLPVIPDCPIPIDGRESALVAADWFAENADLDSERLARIVAELLS